MALEGELAPCRAGWCCCGTLGWSWVPGRALCPLQRQHSCGRGRAGHKQLIFQEGGSRDVAQRDWGHMEGMGLSLAVCQAVPPSPVPSCTGCVPAASQPSCHTLNPLPGCQQKAILHGERAGSELLPGGSSVPCLLLSTLLFTPSKIWFFCVERTGLPLGRDHLH